MTLNVIFVCKLLENLNEQGRNARGEFRYLRGIPLQENAAFFIKAKFDWEILFRR